MARGSSQSQASATAGSGARPTMAGPRGTPAAAMRGEMSRLRSPDPFPHQLFPDPLPALSSDPVFRTPSTRSRSISPWSSTSESAKRSGSSGCFIRASRLSRSLRSNDSTSFFTARRSSTSTPPPFCDRSTASSSDSSTSPSPPFFSSSSSNDSSRFLFCRSSMSMSMSRRTCHWRRCLRTSDAAPRGSPANKPRRGSRFLGPTSSRRRSDYEERKMENKLVSPPKSNHHPKLDGGTSKGQCEIKRKMRPGTAVQNCLNTEILDLEKWLQDQLVLRGSLEKALGHKPPAVNLSNDSPMPKPTKELIREIAILEFEVMHLEQYLLSLYRKAFDQKAFNQQAFALSPTGGEISRKLLFLSYSHSGILDVNAESLCCGGLEIDADEILDVGDRDLPVDLLWSNLLPPAVFLAAHKFSTYYCH